MGTLDTSSQGWAEHAPAWDQELPPEVPEEAPKKTRRSRRSAWVSGHCVTGSEANGGHQRCRGVATVPVTTRASGLMACACKTCKHPSPGGEDE